jgi:hypothetical protein
MKKIPFPAKKNSINVYVTSSNKKVVLVVVMIFSKNQLYGIYGRFLSRKKKSNGCIRIVWIYMVQPDSPKTKTYCRPAKLGFSVKRWPLSAVLAVRSPLHLWLGLSGEQPPKASFCSSTAPPRHEGFTASTDLQPPLRRCRRWDRPAARVGSPAPNTFTRFLLHLSISHMNCYSLRSKITVGDFVLT